MAERLFDELGLNKREAKEIVELFFEEVRVSLENNTRVSSPVSATLTCATSANGRAEIQRRGKKFPSRRGASSRSGRVRN